MSVKLSELLDKVADDVFERSYDCPIEESTAIRTRSRTLRAIAPALVEYVAASHYFLSMDADPDYHDRIQRYKNAWVAVHDAMKAAGVTCE